LATFLARFVFIGFLHGNNIAAAASVYPLCSFDRPRRELIAPAIA
jgi:hypothetical protein